MHIRHLLTATLLVVGLHAGKQDNPSNIPEHERKAYRACVVYHTSNKMKEAALEELNKAYIKNEFEGNTSYPPMLLSSNAMNEAAKMQPELAEQPHGYCENLLNKHMQRTHAGWFEDTYEHPKEFREVANTTKNYITEVGIHFRLKASKVFQEKADALKAAKDASETTNKDENNT